MKTASDVNTIFAYGDEFHELHKAVSLHMVRNVRGKYVLLNKVKSHFIYTYRDYLTTSCTLIDQAIREYKHKLSKAPSQTYKPSNLAISANIDALISKYLSDMSNQNNFNLRSVKKFISQMLAEYSVPELMENEKALGEFREKYLEGAEKRALEVLNKFIRFFKAWDFELMQIEQYSYYQNWIGKIKKSTKDVFCNKQDMEDIQVAAEFLSYNEEIALLSFFTCDVNCAQSIRMVAQEYRQKIGQVDLIRK